jgi:hypothetical protein
VFFLGPVAALAADVEHQTGSTVLVVGLALATIVEAVLIGGVRVHAVSLAGAEARSPTATATAAPLTSGLWGVEWLLGRYHWGNGARTGGTTWETWRK